VIRFLSAGVKHAFGLHRPGRRLPVRSDDILLASYPKSGNKWMRFLIANLLHPDQAVDTENLHQLIVDPDLTVKRDIDRAPRPRIVKSHGSFDPRYRRVIYLVRDPRDVVLSQYDDLRESRSEGDELPMERFIERFLTGDLDHYLGPWGENVGSWLAARSGYPGFLVLRYEDLLASPSRELARVADFAGWPATPERISQAVERSSLDTMHGNEKKQDPSCLPSKSTKSGGWRSNLPEPQAARIEAAWADIMACLGYELVTRDYRKALDSSLIGLLTAGVADARKEVFAGDISPAVPDLPPQRKTIQ
jgi:hypothetical protein